MVKRAFDVLVAGAALVALSPVLALVGLIVRLESSGAVLFRQERVGQGGGAFAMYKFRTMREMRQPEGVAATVPQVADFQEYVFDPLYGGKEFTRVGGLLRSTSLDELPNLFNVLRGDMSIVGPRPEVPELVAQYLPEYRRRHDVLPGITGLAQVNGRSGLTYHEAMLYDLDYVDRHSILMDLGILMRTVPVVFSRKGAR